MAQDAVAPHGPVRLSRSILMHRSEYRSGFQRPPRGSWKSPNGCAGLRRCRHWLVKTPVDRLITIEGSLASGASHHPTKLRPCQRKFIQRLLEASEVAFVDSLKPKNYIDITGTPKASTPRIRRHWYRPGCSGPSAKAGACGNASTSRAEAMTCRRRPTPITPIKLRPYDKPTRQKIPSLVGAVFRAHERAGQALHRQCFL